MALPGTRSSHSEEMWSSYAESHKGVALRIEPNVQKDSKFRLFRPIEYREKRPPLYDDALDFIAGSLFGDQEARRKAILEKIVYSKTLPWQHEGEYRLAIPLREGEPPWNTMKYHPEEITELYLGLAMTKEDKKDIISKAKALNPDIIIFQAARDANTKLTFDGWIAFGPVIADFKTKKGDNRWFHISPNQGGGWIASALINGNP